MGEGMYRIKGLFYLLMAISFLIMGLSSPEFIFAETIILKSGQKIEGKIVEKTKEYVKIDFYGVVLTYFFNEIDSIDGEKIKLSIEQEKAVDKSASDNINDEFYINNDFKFRMKKLPGWEFKESKDIQEGIPMLSLGFIKTAPEGDFKNTLIINISKLNKLDTPLKRGEEFISYADSTINSATKNFDKLTFTKETISINNVNVREAKFEYMDKGYENDVFTTRLMFFEPLEIKSDIINIFVLFKCKSKEYPAFQSDVEKSLMSIEIAE